MKIKEWEVVKDTWLKANESLQPFFLNGNIYTRSFYERFGTRQTDLQIEDADLHVVVIKT